MGMKWLSWQLRQDPRWERERERERERVSFRIMVEGHVLEQLHADQSSISLSLPLCLCLCVSVSEKSPAAPLPSGTSASSSRSREPRPGPEVRSYSLQNISPPNNSEDGFTKGLKIAPVWNTKCHINLPSNIHLAMYLKINKEQKDENRCSVNLICIYIPCQDTYGFM